MLLLHAAVTQTNIVEERKPAVAQRLRQEEQRKKMRVQREEKVKAASVQTGSVPRALERFYKK